MTVEELIEELPKFPEDWWVEFAAGDGGISGSLPIGVLLPNKKKKYIILDAI